MHVELLPNRTHPSDQRQGLPWGFVPAPVRLKFGLFSWQVGASGALLLLQCNNVGFVLQPQQKARPSGRTDAIAWRFLNAPAFSQSHQKPRTDRPDVATQSNQAHAQVAIMASKRPQLHVRALLTQARPRPQPRRQTQKHRVCHPFYPPCGPFLSVQQRRLRTCSPSMQEAFLTVSRCGQSAKPTGNTLHQIQECGGSTALHARAILPLDMKSFSIRSEGAPSPTSI